jgi:hypothetical protein
MNTTRALFLAICATASFPTFAGPDAEALSKCLADHTTDQDRREMARWIFLAMTAHPELKDVSSESIDAKSGADKFMGELVTKLMSEDCVKETRTATLREGRSAMQFAFGSLARLAMQELMANPSVTKSVAAFEEHVDQGKIRSAFFGAR